MQSLSAFVYVREILFVVGETHLSLVAEEVVLLLELLGVLDDQLD
jgi:hypothetical protein